MFLSTLLETQPLPLQSEYRPAAFSFPQTAEKKEYDTRNNSKRHNGHFHAFLSPDENWNSSLAYHVPPPFQSFSTYASGNIIQSFMKRQFEKTNSPVPLLDILNHLLRRIATGTSGTGGTISTGRMPSHMPHGKKDQHTYHDDHHCRSHEFPPL